VDSNNSRAAQGQVINVKKKQDSTNSCLIPLLNTFLMSFNKLENLSRGGNHYVVVDVVEEKEVECVESRRVATQEKVYEYRVYTCLYM
jgi:uncharacterized linocin/CFP29 family protein